MAVSIPILPGQTPREPTPEEIIAATSKNRIAKNPTLGKPKKMLEGLFAGLEKWVEEHGDKKGEKPYAVFGAKGALAMAKYLLKNDLSFWKMLSIDNAILEKLGLPPCINKTESRSRELLISDTYELLKKYRGGSIPSEQNRAFSEATNLERMYLKGGLVLLCELLGKPLNDGAPVTVAGHLGIRFQT